MPGPADRPRRLRPAGLAGLAGLACAACCVVPLLPAGGLLSGAVWAAVGAWIPGAVVVLVALPGTVWWWTQRRRRHRGTCAGGAGCACGG